jgi:ribose 1,5-bisphosphokinase PhnN
MAVEISFNMMFLRLYWRGRESRSHGNLRAFRSIKSQLTAKIFLTPDHTGGVPSATVTRVSEATTLYQSALRINDVSIDLTL